LGLYFALPITLAATPTFTIPQNSPCGWASLATTINDDQDDVVQYSTVPEKGTIGDFHNEIDIMNVSIGETLDVSYSLVIGFVGAASFYEDYLYIIYIDNDSDNQAEYIIFSNVSLGVRKGPVGLVFFLQRVWDGAYWDPGLQQWVGEEVAMYSSVSGHYIRADYISEPFPEIKTYRVAVIAAYIGDPSYIYAEFLPETPSSSIPGFPLEFVLFGFITLLGLVVLLQRNKIKI
jgi:hypothetical protein